MKKFAIVITCLCLLVSSCSTSQLGAAATGSSLGGRFGSSIGGLSGGYRGHEIGNLVGMTAGAAVGIAAASQKPTKPKAKEPKHNIVEYGKYEPSKAGNNDFANAHPLEVVKVVFTDANNNHYLEAYESGALEIIITNRGSEPIYNLSPKVICDNKNIDIASLSPVAEILPQQRVRYRVEIIGKKKLKSSTTRFEVMALNGKMKEVIKSFEIQTLK